MWRKYFHIVKIVPGRVVTRQFGIVDFSSDKVSVETCKALFEADFPYLDITELGKAELYGIRPPRPTPKVSRKRKTKKDSFSG